MGLLLVRDRPQSGEIIQYPPTNGGNHKMANYGVLELGK